MRFGYDFHRHQVPEWADAYVPHSSLKELYIRAIRETDDDIPDFSELYIASEQSINSVGDFYKKRHAMLRINEAELNQRSTLCPVMNADALDSLVENLKDFQRDFNKLQSFFRVNYEALVRIYAKIERSPVRNTQQHQNYKSMLAKLTESRDSLVPSLIDGLDALMKRASHVRGSAETSETLKRSCLKVSIDHLVSSSCLSEHSDSLSLCLLEDRAVDLNKLLENGFKTMLDGLTFGDLLNHLVYLSIICGSKRCIHLILLEAMPKHSIKPNPRLLSQIIVSLSQSRNSAEPTDSIHNARDEGINNSDIPGDNLFHKALQTLGDCKARILSTKDTVDRTSLHHAAFYGRTDICREVLASSQISKDDNSSSLVLGTDFQHYTPLHYAVINNHPIVVKMFLDNLHSTSQADERLLFSLLSIAVRYGLDDIVRLLAKCQIDPQITSIHGETALYLAARTGRESYVKTLLENGAAASVNGTEPVHGWTPLFIACVNGYEDVVRALLQAGARQDLQDRDGWTPKEHAALRGHLALAGLLDPLENLSLSGGPAEIRKKPFSQATLDSCRDKTSVLVNLGVLQNGKSVKAVDLRCAENEEIDGMNGLSIEISVSERESETYVAELPFLTDAANDPFTFSISNPKTTAISFKVSRQVPGYSTSRTLIGSATALLQDPSGVFGENRESLVRERTMPIVEKQTLDVIGTITFTFLIVKPMPNPVSPPMPEALVKAAGVQLVGHRGLGQNTSSRYYLQLGENTVESFLTAAKHGATHVEFDAQLTRDLVPIIFHDFALSESGTDIPVHDLTLDQFMHASNIQSPRGDLISVLGKPNAKAQIRHRSRSLSRDHQRDTQFIRDRMRYTVDFMNKGFKPNTRGDFIQDSFTTLDELLEKLPESIGFNIEVKYPRLHEAAEAGVGPIAIEINKFVDKILERVFRSDKNVKRDIILSSFTPEVSILLALKQKKYPVMFITNAGKPPMTDMEMRASSLQAAVRFAKRWNLAGIVFASESLIMCPRLIAYVKRFGLACGSYGLLNNIPENAKIQAAAGIDTIMADRVGLISKALKDVTP